MRFSRKNWAKFFDGSGKTTTIRLKSSPLGHKNAWCGGWTYPELLGEFDIVDVKKVKFSMLSIDDATADGFSSIKELQDELKKLVYYNDYHKIKDDTDIYIHKIENPINKNEFVKNGMYETRMDNKEIVGKCKQCGKCCHLQTYAGPYKFGSVKNFDEFLSLFDVTQEVYDKLYIHPELSRGTFVLHKDVKCPYLKNDNTCSIYDKRPVLCKEFPKMIKDFDLLKINGVDCGYSLKNTIPKKKVNHILVDEFF